MQKQVIISVASGKGGTGKTTVAINLAKVMDMPLALLDCDVEEPNAHLFLKPQVFTQETVAVPIPEVDESLCNACGDCGQFCQYSAIISLATKPMVFPELCHGCGGCCKVCSQNAISETARRIGIIETSQIGPISFIQGRLDVGVAMAPPLIRAVKKHLQNNHPLAILDAPPGTSCPVITTIRGSDCTLLVSEPTPFGLHDLKLAVNMVRELQIPFGLVINRMGIGDDRLHVFCKDQEIPILMELPNDRNIALAYSKGNLVVDALPEYRKHFEELGQKIMELARTARI